MISKKTCIPCQGGIPPLEHKEISTLMSQLEGGWKVHMNKEIRKKIDPNRVKPSAMTVYSEKKDSLTSVMYVAVSAHIIVVSPNIIPAKKIFLSRGVRILINFLISKLRNDRPNK